MSTVTKFKKEIAEQEADEAKAPIPFEEDEKPAGKIIEVPGDNGEYKAAAKLIEAIEKEQTEIDAISEKAKADKAPHRDEIATLKKEIRDEHSIEAKALSLILAKRRQERRIKEREAHLEEPAKGQFDQLEMAL